MDHLDKPLPSSPEAEKVILAAILLDNSLIYSIVRTLKAEDIYSPLHRAIYKAMSDVFTRQIGTGQTISITSIDIAEELKKRGQLENIGGIATINNLTWGMPHFPNVDKEIERVQKKAKRRELIKTADAIKIKCLEEEDEFKDVVSFAQGEVFKFNEFSHAEQFSTLHEIADAGVESLRPYVDSDTIRKLPQTGFIDIDNMLGGLDPALIILGARPSIGKSTIAWNIAENIAENGGCIHYYSPEMSKEALMWRSICTKTDIPYKRIKIGAITKPELKKLEQAAWEFRNYNLKIYDATNLTAFDMIAKSRQAIVEDAVEPDLIVVDYLQLMNSVEQSKNIYEKVTNISKDLVTFKKTFKKPILAISSLSRPPKGLKVNPPQLTDLRESGQIEFDADQVWLLHRQGFYDESADKSEAQLNIAKNREGPTGLVKLFWDQETHNFGSLSVY